MCIFLAIVALIAVPVGLIAYAIHQHDQHLRAVIRRFDPSVTDDELRNELGGHP